MKNFSVFLAAVIVAMAGGCKEPSNEAAPGDKTAVGAVAESETTQARSNHATRARPDHTSPTAKYSGPVVETMNSGGYTYVQIDAAQGSTWAASPMFEVKVGDTVSFDEGVPMADYHSKTLNRDFDLIHFVGRIAVPGAAPVPSADHPSAGAMPAGHPPVDASAGGQDADFSGRETIEGGQSIAQVFAEKDALAGKGIALRGKVVKYNAGILDRNWLHVRDGTGGEGTNDLTVTTAATVKVGDTVVVKGSLVLDKDFGHGYRYDLIVEDAEVTVED
jgi:hypothetical protein